jgi:hypothetical protein
MVHYTGMPLRTGWQENLLTHTLCSKVVAVAQDARQTKFLAEWSS